jgi:hypothetical protein
MSVGAVGPRVLKAALAVYDQPDPGKPPSALIVFQYNPDQLRRTLAERAPTTPAGKSGAAKQSAQRTPAPPVETITIGIELDATDQLEFPDKHVLEAEHGLHPALAALEMLLYPPVRETREGEKQARKGKVQVAPAARPLVLLVWGRSRVTPVDITGFSVTEEGFDTRLNPIRAKVELTLRVLTDLELPKDSIGKDAFGSYRAAKERLARDFHSRPGGDDSGVRALLPGATPR